jgi:SAM-dependent methyltransferase
LGGGGCLLLLDYFGIDVDEREIGRWNVLAATTEFLRNSIEYGGDRIDPSSRGSSEVAKIWIPLDDERLRCGMMMEVGCGFGRLALDVLEVADEYIGVDISTLCVGYSSHMFSRIDRARFLHTVYDSDSIASLEGKIGGIFGANFFYHQDQKRILTILSGARRLLKYGGWISVDIIPMGNVHPVDVDVDDHDFGNNWKAFRVDPEMIAMIARGMGYSVNVIDHTFPWGFDMKYIICEWEGKGDRDLCGQG